MAEASNKSKVVHNILVVAGTQTATFKNKKGLTPLELLQSELGNTNDFFEEMLGICGIAKSNIEKSKCMIMLELSLAEGKPIPPS